jgi:RNA polymerase sigma-70 factor (ECF subfamily)
MKSRSPGSPSPGDADMPAFSNEQLVLEALDDSHLAFEQLVKRYQYRVLRTIASIIGDEQTAQDVAQDTFLSAWSDLPKLKEKPSLEDG